MLLFREYHPFGGYHDVGSAIGAVGSIASGFLGSKSSKDAASAQAQFNAQAIAEQRAAREQARRDLGPFREAGTDAINFLRSLLLGRFDTSGGVKLGGRAGNQARIASLQKELDNLLSAPARPAIRINMASGFGAPQHLTGAPIQFTGGGGTDANRQARIDELRRRIDELRRAGETGRVRATLPADFESVSPGFRFRRSEGEKALVRSQAARGGLLSGRAVKEALRYNQDFASNEFGNFIKRIFSLSEQGRGAAAQSASAGMGAANSIASLLANTGQAQAQGILGSAASISGGISSAIENVLSKPPIIFMQDPLTKQANFLRALRG